MLHDAFVIASNIMVTYGDMALLQCLFLCICVGDSKSFYVKIYGNFTGCCIVFPCVCVFMEMCKYRWELWWSAGASYGILKGFFCEGISS